MVVNGSLILRVVLRVDDIKWRYNLSGGIDGIVHGVWNRSWGTIEDQKKEINAQMCTREELQMCNREEL